MSPDHTPDEAPSPPDSPAGAAEPPAPIDLTGEDSPPGERPTLTEAPPYSPEWAKIIWPITRTMLALIAAVMLVPFLIVVLAEPTRAASAIDWAKTVLPPVVGFGGAIVGYYFGTRSAAPPSNDEG